MLHNTIHYLEFLDERKERPNLRWTLHEDFQDYLGECANVCMFCLGTNGCKLKSAKTSNGKSYIATDKSCINGRYIKLSVGSVDARRSKQFKSSKRSQNICSNRPIMCRVPGCGQMH